MRRVNHDIDGGHGGPRVLASPYLLALAAFFLSTQATVSGLAEYAELRAGLRLGDRDGLIRSAPRTARASLFPGRDIFETRNLQQRGAIQLASLDGEVAAPQAETRRYPAVNRAGKGNRRVMRDGTRAVLRMDPRTGRLVRLSLPAPGAKELALRGGAPAPSSAAKTETSAIPLPPNVTALAARANAAAEKQTSPKAAIRAAKRSRDLMCLAKAVYFEARGEPETGQLAVAQVVLNRVAHPFYPDNICAVVFQNQRLRNKCQFSFACDGRTDRPRNETSWARAIHVAKKSMHGKRIEGLGKSTHYHANYVRPRWISDMVKLKRIGKHIFYRVRAWS